MRAGLHKVLTDGKVIAAILSPQRNEMGAVGCLDSVFSADLVETKGFLGGFRKSDL